jgi:hypothetical protein
VCQRDDDAHHLRRVRVQCDPADERAVDFHGVDLKLMKLAERRVSDAEVVDAPLDADRPQTVQDALRAPQIADGRAFQTVMKFLSVWNGK